MNLIEVVFGACAIPGLNLNVSKSLGYLGERSLNIEKNAYWRESGFNPVDWLLVVIFLLAFVGAFLPVWSNLLATWAESDQYSHGFLILPISLLLAWQKKEILKAIRPLPSRQGLFLAIAALGIYLIAYLSEILTLASIAMWLFVCGTVLYWWGTPIVKVLLFQLFFLLFMIPVPSQIFATLTVPLQLFVSKISVMVAQIAGVPTLREGNIINIPGHSLQVVQACSGLRSIVSLLMLSAVWGYLRIRSKWLRTAIFLLGVPIAIIVNIVRVILLIMAFYFFDYDLSTGSIHTYFGIAIFFLALLLLGALTKMVTKWDSRSE
ncbi:MAG: exosortase [Desulfatitalea sp.]